MNVLLRLTAIAIVLAGSPLFAQTPERGDRRPERGDRMETRRDQSSGNKEKFGQRIREFVEAGKLTREEAGELLRLAFPEVPRPRGRGRTFEVKDPADFIKPQEKAIFSGPQSGEKISNFMIQGMNGDYAEKDFDPIAEAKDKPLLLLFQDDSGVGFRGLAGWSQVLPVIREQESTDLEACVVILGDDPAALSNSTQGLRRFLGDKIVLALSKDGRDGPGQLGLNRNVAMTAILVKDGIVKSNFAFTQPQLTPDPYVLGGVAELIGVERGTLYKWLGDATAKRQRMRMERK